MKSARQIGVEWKFIGYRCPNWAYAQCKAIQNNEAKWKYVDFYNQHIVEVSTS